MAYIQHLPEDVVDLIRERPIAEFATLTNVGVPIDTPTYYFPSADLKTLDIGTGLGYPAKANRARNNPKVGMLIEGTADQPVISIAGFAAVRDSDFQANLDRYLAETILAPNVNPETNDWSQIRQTMAYYLTRVIVCTAPAHVRWWTNRAAMDDLPQKWRAPANTVYPTSDPAPPGKASESSHWPENGWQDLAQSAVAQGLPAHLTLCDADGFPLPIRLRDCALLPGGFSLSVPKGAPWSEGKATLSFAGKEIFVGDVTRKNDTAFLRVERALPVFPLIAGRRTPDVFAAVVKRMEFELRRRGATAPIIPEHPPAPTEGAKLREAASRALNLKIPGGGAYTE